MKLHVEHRQHPFVEYEDNIQFQDAADKFCVLATEKVKTFRNQFKSIQNVLSRINEKIDDQGRIKNVLFEIRLYGPWCSKRRLDLWSTYYPAVLSGLIGKAKEADKFFRS